MKAKLCGTDESHNGVILAYLLGLIMLGSVSSVLSTIFNPSFVTIIQEGVVEKEKQKRSKKKKKKWNQRGICRPMFIAALVIFTQRWKQVSINR